MCSEPKITIITVCFNAEKIIEKTIQSVINQSYENIEYIIIDGFSTDGTMKIISKYEQYIDNIICEPDEGIYDAFNKGIKYSTGEIIHFLNAGDYYHDQKVISDVISQFNNFDNIDYLHGTLKTLDAITSREEYYSFPHFENKIENIESIINGYTLPHPAFFVRKGLFIKYGYFNKDYKIVSDNEFMIKCLLNEKGCYFNRIITVFKKDGISSNPYYKDLLIKELNELKRDLLGVHIDDTNEVINLKKNCELLKIWNKFLITKNKGITNVLHKDYKNIVIFGTKDIAEMLYFDCLKEGLNVVGFIDNNYLFTNSLFEKNVYDTNWLINNHDYYDICIVTIESHNDIELLNNLSEKIDKKIISWKYLVSLCIRYEE